MSDVASCGSDDEELRSCCSTRSVASLSPALASTCLIEPTGARAARARAMPMPECESGRRHGLGLEVELKLKRLASVWSLSSCDSPAPALHGPSLRRSRVRSRSVSRRSRARHCLGAAPSNCNSGFDSDSDSNSEYRVNLLASETFAFAFARPPGSPHSRITARVHAPEDVRERTRTTRARARAPACARARLPVARRIAFRPPSRCARVPLRLRGSNSATARGSHRNTCTFSDGAMLTNALYV